MKYILTGFLLIMFNTIHPQIQKIGKTIASPVKEDCFNGSVSLAQKWQTELLTYKGLSNRHYQIPFYHQPFERFYRISCLLF